ncbi:MAG: peptidase M20 [Chloroflexota bacterium]|nr:MAG: peptidase M20 [Anaerolineaceae bacterium 4572_5.2]RLD09549.1 MAG: peptidase M20 [Chloroflexota bacterium]
MKPQNNISSISQRPAKLLQRLIQFDTTNPPGDETECISYLNTLLTEAGIETTILGKTPERTNLIARLPGQGNASPFLLYGHVDVVTTKNQTWQHPPFEGKIADDFLWGRGALDMKGGIAMMVAAVLRAKAEGTKLPGDVILTVVGDEEAGGNFGAKFLVEEHKDLFKGVSYAIGEFGGFTLYLGGQKFYPIMISEKQSCWMKAVVRGPGGHGSMPVRGGAMAKLARLLTQLDKRRLPVHITPTTRLMLEAVSAELSGVTGFVLKQLMNPLLTNTILDLLGERGYTFNPLLHNTVSATILKASDKVNVIPGEVAVHLDGRLLPGYTPDDMISELRQIVGDDVEIEVESYDPGPAEPDMALFGTLADILKKADPEGVPIPFLLSGVTDARFFSRLGIQTYGFLPMQLPKDFNFTSVIHAADERIPVGAVEFGTNAIHELLQRFGDANTGF